MAQAPAAIVAIVACLMAFVLSVHALPSLPAKYQTYVQAAMAAASKKAKQNGNKGNPTDEYVLLPKEFEPVRVAFCYSSNPRCHFKILYCPKQCPQVDTSGPGKAACFVDCSTKCETTCRHRRANCHKEGSVCFDPRFVGGDGVMFYFHGRANQDFCLVSDRNLHINAHFIGLRPQGRTRDFTWVQALGIMFSQHRFSVAAKHVATWDEEIDQLAFHYDGLSVDVPTGRTSSWSSTSGEVVLKRTADVNGVSISIGSLMEAFVNVVPITEQDNKLHNYQISSDNCFAHLEVQFKFFNLSSTVDGILGQTYRPDFKNPVAVGVPMPIMKGEAKFWSSSLFATDCKVNKFGSSASEFIQPLVLEKAIVNCGSKEGGGGLFCRR